MVHLSPGFPNSRKQASYKRMTNKGLSITKPCTPSRPQAQFRGKASPGGVVEGGYAHAESDDAFVCEILNPKPETRNPNPEARNPKHEIIDSGLWEGCRESRRCSRDTCPESYITKYTSVRR